MPKKNDRAIDRAIKLAGSPGALAKKLNVSPQRVNNWRARDMPADMILLAAEKYGVSCVFLATGKQGPEGAPWPLPSVSPDRWAEMAAEDRARVDNFALGLAGTGGPKSGGPPESHGSAQHRAAS